MNDNCDCPIGYCEYFCQPTSYCVMRIDGSHLKACRKCSDCGFPWHDADGNCLKCKRIKENE